MNDQTKLIIGIAAGAVAGAVTALLVAPTTGKQLRSDIAKESNSIAKELSALAAKAGEEYGNKVKQVGENLINSAKKEAAGASN